MQKQDSSDKVQSRDKAMELLITLEPALSFTELRLGCVSVCVSGVVTKQLKGTSLDIKVWVCPVSENALFTFFFSHKSYKGQILEMDYGYEKLKLSHLDFREPRLN